MFSEQPPEVFYKKSILKNFVKFNVIRLRPATLSKKRLRQVFPYEFREIFKNTYFTEHFRTTTPGSLNNSE